MKPHGHLEVLLLRRLGRLQHAARAGRIDGERLLHEHVDALWHGVLEVQRAEGGVRGQEHHVAGPEAVDRLLVGVEAEEAALGRHVDLVRERRLARFFRLPWRRSSNRSAMA